jgi:hypothetical protein
MIAQRNGREREPTWSPELRDCRAAGLYCRTPRLQSCGTAELQNSETAELTAELQNSETAELWDCRTAGPLTGRVGSPLFATLGTERSSVPGDLRPRTSAQPACGGAAGTANADPTV